MNSIRTNVFLKNGFLLIVLFILILCSVLALITSHEKIKRPIDPWVIRSVLDSKPRMLTMALDSECYVAYDLENCNLYRAWKGGVNWDGAVYTEVKVTQPTVWGTDYFLNSSMESWSIQQNGRTVDALVRFQGYIFVDEQVILNYRLTTSEDTILVSERPDFVLDENGKPGLRRTFFTRDIDPEISIFLNTQPRTITLNRDSETISTTFFEPIPKQVPNTGLPKSANVGKYWIEKSDCFTCHDWNEKTVGPGFQQIAEKYPKNEEVVDILTERIKNGGTGVWGTAAMNPHPNISDSDLKTMVEYILSLDKGDYKGKKSISKKKSLLGKNIKDKEEVPMKPGFGAPLEGVHPSYDVSTIHATDQQFKVGGMAFLPDGTLLISTWSPRGNIYLLEGVETGDSVKVKSKIIADGLAEPLGLEVVNGEIFVLQKHELTQLIDHNGDDIIDEYKAICNRFGVTSDFHEFAFGLVFKDGYFYANLSLPLRLMANEKPHPDRGRTIKIALDGSYEWVNSGLRTPNGIGIGIDDQLFVTDNQGQWLPANKLLHVRPGDFHGMRWNLPDSESDLEMTPPTVWLPQDEIANSPSEPTLLSDGPYSNQIIFGDVSHGGIKRVFLEEVNGSYQGVVFRFTQGLEAGINRIVTGPDGALYVGGVGMSGGWSWKNKKHGLQRMIYNNKVTFDILAIRSKPNGFEIEFTEPLGENIGSNSSDYLIQQWWYLPTESYGGPKMDLETMTIQAIQISSDRTKVQLTILGLKPKHVVYFRLNDKIQSTYNQSLWSGEGWYTLNNIPQETS